MGRQGNPNPIYYQLAASEYGLSGNGACNSSVAGGAAGSCTFYDVTQGDMDVNCTGANNCYRPSGTHGVLSTLEHAHMIPRTALPRAGTLLLESEPSTPTTW